MEPNEPTTIIVQWLTTTPENTPHLRAVYTAGGTAGLHQEVREYFQEHNSRNTVVEHLAQWGIAHDSPGPTRSRMLAWVLSRLTGSILPPVCHDDMVSATLSLLSCCRDDRAVRAERRSGSQRLLLC